MGERRFHARRSFAEASDRQVVEEGEKEKEVERDRGADRAEV